MDKQQLLRIGRISSYNFPDGTARVTYDDKDGSTTPEIPFLAWEHWRPKIGDQVLVGHLSNGTSRAIILGPFWYEGHRPHGGREGLYRQEYTSTLGGDAAEYDEKTASLTIQAGGCTITLVGGKVTVDAPSGVEVTTTVTAATEVTAGAIKLTQHTHTGVHGETSKPH